MKTELREKVCKTCLSKFMPARPMQSVCSHICASKKVKADKKAERETFKKRKEAIKTIPDLLKEAQTTFNSFIRGRDKDQPCISCGKPPGPMTELHAGRDAGHYRSVGSASHLRFNEDNCHAQCVKCNQWKAGNAVDYRIRLIELIGLERVEALERENTPHKWTREELIEIRAKYKRKLKELP